MEEFYKEITEWLLPKDYKEVYSNHPLSENREFHFSKDGIRVVCKRNVDGVSFFYLQKDILELEKPLSIRTANYNLKDKDLDILHNFIKDKSEAVKNIPNTVVRFLRPMTSEESAIFKERWKKELEKPAKNIRIDSKKEAEIEIYQNILEKAKGIKYHYEIGEFIGNLEAKLKSLSTHKCRMSGNGFCPYEDSLLGCRFEDKCTNKEKIE